MRDWKKLNIADSIASSTSYSEALKKLGITPNSGNIKNLKRWIVKLELDTNHFKKFGEGNGGNVSHKIELKDILVENSTYNSSRLKSRLIKDGILEHKCSSCGISEWMNSPISLQLDHINGNSLDNRLENLRILCPNCHSQTSTFCVRNKKGKKKDYKCSICGCNVSKGKSRCWDCWCNKRRAGGSNS